MNIRIINRSHHPHPAYATALSAGMDLRAPTFGTLSRTYGPLYGTPTGL